MNGNSGGSSPGSGWLRGSELMRGSWRSWLISSYVLTTYVPSSWTRDRLLAKLRVQRSTGRVGSPGPPSVRSRLACRHRALPRAQDRVRPLVGGVPADDHWRVVVRDRRVRQLGVDGCVRGGPVDGVQIRWERRGGLDLMPVEVDPLRLIDGDGTDEAPGMTVRGDEAAVGDRALREQDLVPEVRDAHRLDVHAELDRPERRHRDVRQAVHRRAHHIVRGDARPASLRSPSARGQGTGSRTAGAENAETSPATKTSSTTRPSTSKARHPASVDDAERPGGQARVAQPLRVSYPAERDDGDVDVDPGPVRQRRAPYPPVRRHLRGCRP